MFTRRQKVTVYRDGAPLRCTLEIGDSGVSARVEDAKGAGLRPALAFEHPRAEIAAKKGGGRHLLFKPGSPAAWWVSITDAQTFDRLDVLCKSKFQALQIKGAIKLCGRAR